MTQFQGPAVDIAARLGRAGRVAGPHGQRGHRQEGEGGARIPRSGRLADRDLRAARRPIPPIVAENASTSRGTRPLEVSMAAEASGSARIIGLLVVIAGAIMVVAGIATYAVVS